MSAFVGYCRVLACLRWEPPPVADGRKRADRFKNRAGRQAGTIVRPLFAAGDALSVAEVVRRTGLPKSTVKNIIAADARPQAPDRRRLVRLDGEARYRRDVL